ncbi:hypothetical protein [Streptomyces marincola]|uniref:hypothetical protein n=1 Tax=Streptomyces marincola TaxID=2878388 RepID=UPI001CF240EE|nr:hypothetical protein [Streptomyces marincola]UCM88860.1 hypothetical protein LC193_13365 [Streptomyces marincola]
MLEPFGVEPLAPEHTARLAAAGLYGEDWSIVGGWFGPAERHLYGAAQPEWADTTLPEL